MSFEKDLREAQKLKRTIAIYIDAQEMESFYFGFINSIDEEYAYINHISRNGEEDGIAVIRLCDIFRVEYGGEYSARIEKLYRIKKQSHEEYPSYENFEKFLKEMKLSKSIVSVSFGSSDNDIEVAGIIEKIEGRKIYLGELSGFAENLGMIILDKADIYSIKYGTKYEKDMKLLFDDLTGTKQEK